MGAPDTNTYYLNSQYKGARGSVDPDGVACLTMNAGDPALDKKDSQTLTKLRGNYYMEQFPLSWQRRLLSAVDDALEGVVVDI
jgi:hypothetical protein